MHPEILSMALFWIVAAYTPGPNNVIASYSGFNFGIKKTLPHIFGVALGFTFLNPHVYSDTVFILGNFSKNYLLKEKIIFGIGASIASFLFFFLIGYLSNFFSKYAQNRKIWKIINLFIITFMSFLTFLVFLQIIN